MSLTFEFWFIRDDEVLFKVVKIDKIPQESRVMTMNKLQIHLKVSLLLGYHGFIAWILHRHFLDCIHFDDNQIDIKKAISDQAFGELHELQNILSRILIFQRELLAIQSSMICSVISSC